MCLLTEIDARLTCGRASDTRHAHVFLCLSRPNSKASNLRVNISLVIPAEARPCRRHSHLSSPPSLLLLLLAATGSLFRLIQDLVGQVDSVPKRCLRQVRDSAHERARPSLAVDYEHASLEPRELIHIRQQSIASAAAANTLESTFQSTARTSEFLAVAQ